MFDALSDPFFDPKDDAAPGPLGYSYGPQVAAGLAAPTPVLTPKGYRRLGSLRPGDDVVTRDHGVLPVLWRSRPTDSCVLDVPDRGDGPTVRATPWAERLVASKSVRVQCGEHVALARLLDLTESKAPSAPRQYRLARVIWLALPRHALIDVDGAWIGTLSDIDLEPGVMPVEIRRDLFNAVPRFRFEGGRGALACNYSRLDSRECRALVC